jgi:hypothetical protein
LEGVFKESNNNECLLAAGLVYWILAFARMTKEGLRDDGALYGRFL